MSTAPSSSRDDGTLIQIDTLGDWERIQNNFSDAIERALDAQLGPTASGAVRDALRQHLIHVCSSSCCGTWTKSNYEDPFAIVAE